MSSGPKYTSPDTIWQKKRLSVKVNCEERGDFGYSGTSLAAREVLYGKYEFGEDFDQATKRLMTVIADIR
eukprot:scaffold40638_cov42-Cyclotella_meneghiniana.AAC.3